MTSEMLNILNDREDGTPLYGSLCGIMGGVAFMIGVEGIGQDDSSYRIPTLRDQIHGLQEAKSTLAGTPQTIKLNARNINKAISHKHIEIKQAMPHHPPLGQAAAEIEGPLVGGLALGAFVFTAVGARIRLFRQHRIKREPSTESF